MYWQFVFPFLGEQSNKGFHTFTPTSFQETRIQELPEYFSPKQNTTCVKYSVSIILQIP